MIKFVKELMKELIEVIPQLIEPNMEFLNEEFMTYLLSAYEIIEAQEQDFSNIKIDTPVLVKNHWGKNWVKRHFYKQDLGTIYCFKDGKTSYTIDKLSKNIEEWKYCKLPLIKARRDK